MNIIKDFIPEGRRNRPGLELAGPDYVTIHDTGNPSAYADAAAHAAYLQTDTAASIPASWHFTVDGGSIERSPQIYQHLPLDEVGWHAGDGRSGPGNRSSIGIEICENEDGDREIAEMFAAELAAFILEKFRLDISRIKQHYDWNGKNCPRVLRGEGRWEEFLERVKGYMAGDKVPKRALEAIEYWQKKIGIDPEYWKEQASQNEHIGWLLVLMQRIHQRER